MPLFSLFLISSSICSVDYLLSGWLLCRLMMSLNPSNALKSGMMPPQIVSKCFALSKTVSSFFGKIIFFVYFCDISSMHFMTPSIAVFLSLMVLCGAFNSFCWFFAIAKPNMAYKLLIIIFLWALSPMRQQWQTAYLNLFMGMHFKH